MREQETDTAGQLIAILRASLRGESCRIDRTTDWTALVQLARRHNLQHIAAETALREENAAQLQPETLLSLQKIVLQSVAVSETQRYEAQRLLQRMEEAGLSVMPIKGLCTRERYPSQSFRSMGDLDFLYRPEQTGAVRAQMRALGYTLREGRKHDTYHLPPYVYAELHRQLVASESAQAAYFSDIWSRAVPIPGTRHCFRMRAEDEYLFNLVHFAEHLREGGAGIRFLMDVFVYEQTPLDRAYLNAELQRIGLSAFYENVRAVADSWFGDASAALTPLQEQLATFVTAGGVFGNADNAASLAVRDGRLAYIVHFCFPNYESMCSMFPWLQKAPALLPISWVVRGCSALCRRPDRVWRKFGQMLRGNRQRGRDLGTFLELCGL